MKPSEKKLAPPYLSWKTFIGFIKSFDQGLPPRIDKSAMGRLSGGNQNLMLNALTYLQLINSDKKPEPLLEQIVDSFSLENQVEYKARLATMLKNAYTFLFDGTGDFNLERSTSAQFDERFKAENASGETIQKCEAFFMAAAREAGIKISRLILDSKKKGPKRVSPGGSPKSKSSKSDKKGEEFSIPPITPPHPIHPPVQELPKWYTTFRPAFDKLPAFENPHWAMSERSKWITALSGLLDLYITIDKEE